MALRLNILQKEMGLIEILSAIICFLAALINLDGLINGLSYPTFVFLFCIIGGFYCTFLAFRGR